MAVYERCYKGYLGALTPAWSRFLVLPRYALQQVFASKAFVVFLVLCYVFPLFCAVVIYLPHNLSFLELFQIEPSVLHAITDFWFPTKYMGFQVFMGFLLALFTGPALVSADLRNNGLPLYLSRPFSRTEYVAGKMSVLVILLSAITWIPGLLLFAFQSYLMGLDWLAGNLRTGAALFVVSWVWIIVVSLAALAVSAYVKWKPIARIALVALFFVSAAFGNLVNAIFGTRWGRVLDLPDMVGTVWANFLGKEPSDFPLAGAVLSLASVVAICLLLLARKVRAYEVVR